MPLYRRVRRVFTLQSPATDYKRVISFLESRSVEDVAHVHGNMLPHLEGTFELLQKWGNPAPLCIAGLCHSVYGTDNFEVAILDVSQRDELRALIGPEAEAIVYLFASCDRRHLYEQVGRSSPIQIRNRFTGEVFVPDSLSLKMFFELTFANELQLVGSNAAWIESSRPMFESLFTRCRGLVSEAAYAHFAHVYGGVHDVQLVNQTRSARPAQETI